MKRYRNNNEMFRKLFRTRKAVFKAKAFPRTFRQRFFNEREKKTNKQKNKTERVFTAQTTVQTVVQFSRWNMSMEVVEEMSSTVLLLLETCGPMTSARLHMFSSGI